jgi:hypothetical protein
MIKKIGITGTRQGATTKQLIVFKELLYSFEMVELHHGDCLGADEQAHDIARGHCIIIIHPPENPKYRAFCEGAHEVLPMKEYKKRNCDIVDAAELVIGLPKKEYEEQRSGTWHALRYARKIGKPVIVIWPNGTKLEINLDKKEEIR